MGKIGGNLLLNNCTIQVKLKSFNFLYLIKLFLLIKKIYPRILSKVFFLPDERLTAVILRSPFIYKSSRLKFKFEKKSLVVFFNLFFSNELNDLIYFFSSVKTKNTFNSLIYKTKIRVKSFDF